MIDNNLKLSVLEEILASPEFKDSKRYQDLLRYLVEETMAGHTPKEITVGIKFFEKGSSFDPKEDTTVRVYINNLRKKLDHYYLTSTVKNPYQLVIPRGHYSVQFIEKKIKEPVHLSDVVPNKSVLFTGKFLVLYLILVFISGIGVTLLFLKFQQPKVAQNNLIWNEFVKPNGRPTLVLIGDFFFLYQRSDSGVGRFIRDPRINTPEDYKQMIKDNPIFAKEYVQSNFTYLRPSSCWGLSYLIPYLQNSPNGFSLKLASQFTMEDAKTNNIIYLGSFKNLYNLQKILQNFNIDYKLSPAGFYVNVHDSVKYFSPIDSKGGNYEKDYSIVAKAQGPEGSTIILLLGFADTGIIEAARFISDPKVIEENFLNSDSSNPYFTAVIETEGINQSINKAHIKYLSNKTFSVANKSDSQQIKK